jgi:glycosyltransferase involved in cell wall biosynthesis
LRTENSVSVALCTYNGEKYLGEQLASISDQSLLPSELVVCDDGSVDATPEIVASFARSASFPVRFIKNSTNIGSVRNFEQAIRLCRSEFIALCDQDDWWNPRKLEILANTLRTSCAGGVFSNGFLMNGESKLTGGTLWNAFHFHESGSRFHTLSEREQGISLLLNHNMVTGATMMFRSRLRDKLLPVPEEWVHDAWLAWMLVLHSQLIACSDPLIRYRLHGSQQIGLGNSLFVRLRRARETRIPLCRSIQKQFAILCTYIQSHPEIDGPDLRQKILERIEHAAFRADLAPNSWQRWKQIMAERSAYRAYSRGWRSMLKDALL